MGGRPVLENANANMPYGSMLTDSDNASIRMFVGSNKV